MNRQNVMLFGLVLVLSIMIGHAAAIGDPVIEKAASIRNDTHTDMEFVNTVNDYVEGQVNYYVSGSMVVQPAEWTLKNLRGCCSEKAVLKQEMLESQGIESRLVYGYYQGIYHETVEVRVGQYAMFITPSERDWFTKTGDGLAPGLTIGAET